MTQKYEFESIEAMMDYFDGEEIKILSQIPTSNGILVEVEENIPIVIKNEDPKIWILVCYPNENIQNPMYWGKKGPTYIKSECALFTEKQIDDKLRYMYSYYNWKKVLF